MTETSHSAIRGSFDRAALRYDADFESLPATRRLRSITGSIFLKYFHRGDSLLELNCGTGTDALFLASHGMRILATDASAAMVDMTCRKIRESGARELLTARRLAFEELPLLKGQCFDGVYSDMGGLNCTDNLDSIASSLRLLIKPGGFAIVCLMGDISVWETAAFLMRGRFGQAFRRRRRDGVLANVYGELVRTFYYSPARVARSFFPGFNVKETVGLNIFTPPPTSRRAYTRLGKWNRWLERIDDALSHGYPFNRIGDHFLIVVQRSSR